MNVLIAEDEAPAARRLEHMVRERLGPRLDAIAVAPTAEAARAALEATRVDLLLLDLNLNGVDGFSVLDAAERPCTIVVSARSDRAIDAFDHAVVDFVTKPVSADRLGLALNRALDRALERAAAPRPGLGSLVVRSAGRMDLAAFDNIVALSGADDYVEVVLADGRCFLHDARLQDLEQRLPSDFVRIHRSHIVNAAHARSIVSTPNRRRKLELTNRTSLPISRSRLKAIEKLFAAD